MSIIITETRNGQAYPDSAYICRDESDFIERINSLAAQRRSNEAFDIETTEQAISYLNETFAQSTAIITEADYMKGVSYKLDCKARELGWIPEEQEDDE